MERNKITVSAGGNMPSAIDDLLEKFIWESINFGSDIPKFKKELLTFIGNNLPEESNNMQEINCALARMFNQEE